MKMPGWIQNDPRILVVASELEAQWLCGETKQPLIYVLSKDLPELGGATDPLVHYISATQSGQCRKSEVPIQGCLRAEILNKYLQYLYPKGVPIEITYSLGLFKHNKSTTADIRIVGVCGEKEDAVKIVFCTFHLNKARQTIQRQLIETGSASEEDLVKFSYEPETTGLEIPRVSSSYVAGGGLRPVATITATPDLVRAVVSAWGKAATPDANWDCTTTSPGDKVKAVELDTCGP